MSVASSYRSADVSWDDGNEGRCEKASASAPQLLCEEVGGDGCEAREDWRQEDANVPDVDGQVEWVKDVVDGTGGEHQARVHSASDDAPQRVPRSLVEPVEEVVEPMLYHVGCRPVVEPAILFAIRFLNENYISVILTVKLMFHWTDNYWKIRWFILKLAILLVK